MQQKTTFYTLKQSKTIGWKWVLLIGLLSWLCAITCLAADVIYPNVDNSPPTEDTTALQMMLVYNKEFAKQFGLELSKAISLEPGIYAIALVVIKVSSLIYNPTLSFYQKHKLIHLTGDEATILKKHMELLSVLFPNEKIPIQTDYLCYLQLYLNSTDPKVQSIKMPDQNIIDFNATDNLTDLALNPLILSLDPFTQINTSQKYIPFTAPYSALAKDAYNFISKINYHPIGFQAQFVNFISGINFILLGPIFCQEMQDINDHNGTILWINKTVNKIARSPSDDKFYLTDYVSFKIPTQITQAGILQPIYASFNH